MKVRVKMLQDNCIDDKTRIKCYEIIGYSMKGILDRAKNTVYNEYWWCQDILDIKILEGKSDLSSLATSGLIDPEAITSCIEVEEF